MFRITANGSKVDEDGFRTSTTTPKSPYFCVAVKIGDDIQVRDTKDATKTTLTFNRGEWRAFIEGVKKGEFDV